MADLQRRGNRRALFRGNHHHPRQRAPYGPSWTFHTGDQPHASGHGAIFEDTPILADGKLLVCTPSDRVIALDPLTGRQDWAFDPKLSAGLKPANDFVCRGVAVWHDPSAAPVAVCGARVILATLDARVIELDLATGSPCAEFRDQRFCASIGRA
jgi:quinoprotein glucose dehydrogenase